MDIRLLKKMRRHRRLFRLRVFVGMLVAGMLFLYFISLVLEPSASIVYNGVPTTAFDAKLSAALIAGVVLVGCLGLLLVPARALDHKRLLLFQSLGKSRPYRYLGEYVLAATNTVDAPSTASRTLRKAIVFTLRRIAADEEIVEQQSVELRVLQDLSLESTTTLSMREVRTKQALFSDSMEAG